MTRDAIEENLPMIWGHCTPLSFVAVLGSAETPAMPAARNVLFNGIAYFTDAPPAFQLESLAPRPEILRSDNAAGEWVRIDVRPDGALVAETDFFGYYQLFYTTPLLNGRNITAVSNAFPALVSFLLDRGCDPQVDAAFAAPILASRHRFLHQAHVNHTGSPYVRRLGVDERLVVGRSAGVEKRTYFATEDDARPYDSLITAGIERATATLREIVAASKMKTSKIYLSGGRDSRAALAVMLAGLAPDQIKCVALNPEDRPKATRAVYYDDLRIATAIVNECGLEWHKKALSDFANVGFEDSIRQWSLARSNAYFYFEPGGLKLAAARREAPEIRGGGGEVLRGFWRSTALGTSQGKDSRADARRFYRQIVKTDTIPVACKDLAEALFVDEIARLPGASFLEKIDNHYAAFRNRYHFGHIRKSFYDAGRTVFFPLSQIEFLRAAQKTPYAIRRHGLVVFDIIERVAPALNDLELESKPWPEPVQARRRRVANRRAPDLAAKSGYLKMLNRTRRLDQARKNLIRTEGFDAQAAMSARLAQNLEVLRDSLGGQLCDYVLEGARASTEELKRATVKSESIADAVLARHLPYALVTLGASAGGGYPAWSG